MEENKSENEELRKQIQYLTDVIENAKSRNQLGNQKSLHSSHTLPAKYTQLGSASRTYKPSFHKGASHPGYADWNIHNRAASSTYTADTSHSWGPSDRGQWQSALQYNTHHTKAKPHLSNRVIDTEKSDAIKLTSESRSVCHQNQSVNNRDAVDRKALEIYERTKLKHSLSSGVVHHGSTAAALPLTNYSDTVKSAVTNIKSAKTAAVALENKRQSLMKSKSAVLNTDHGQMKSSLNSGNLNKKQIESNSKLLQEEIEKMHSKIAELKKTLSEKKSTSDNPQQEKNMQTSCKSSSILEKSGAVMCNSPLKKIALESNRSSLSSPEKYIKHEASSSVTTFGSPVKQQKYSPQKSDTSVTKSNAPTKYICNKDSTLLSGKLPVEQNKPCEKSGAQRIDVAKVTATVTNMNTDLKQPQSDLVSLSKYKLTRVPSSPIKHSPRKVGGSSMGSTSETLDPVEKINAKSIISSVKNQSVIFAPATKSRSSTSTPAKFIKKSKYSITRIRNSGKKGSSRKKLVRSQSSTPAKFVSFSKYAIKRVRRSLSDENKQVLQNNTSLYKTNGLGRKGSPYSDSVQSSVRIVRSKFKMEKMPSHTNIKNHFVSAQVTQSYKFQKRNPYKQGRHQAFGQRYQHRPYWSARYGFNSYSKRGRYNGRYKGGRTGYGVDSGRYGKQFQYHTYNRRLAVSQRYLQRRLQRLKETVPFNPRHRLDRRTVVRDLKRPVNFLMINGMLYKSNTKTLVKAVSQKARVTQTAMEVQQPKIKKLDTTNMKTVTVRGVKFKVDSRGRSLKRIHQPGTAGGKPDAASSSKASEISRIDIGGVTYMQTKPGTLERVGSVKSRLAATRVVNKTVQQAAAKYKKDNTKVTRKKKYCMFYNRFGKCNRKGSCTYVHDPDKVAVCTRFLRGKCKVKDCPFSHKISKDKMPVCSYYLKGVCNRDDCPYLHVNVNRDAEICQDFVKGYCPLGEKCKKKHILKCPEFVKTGSCSKGEKCSLQHRRRKRKSQLSEHSTLENSKKPKLIEQPISSTSANIPVEARLSAPSSVPKDSTQADKHSSDYESDFDLPFKERKLPAYISLKTNSNIVQEDAVGVLEDTKKLSVKPAMKIRPQL